MIDYETIKSIRGNLLNSLTQWESKADGFYHSAPLVDDRSSPSFTNTGIVLQAFNESGCTSYSQKLADRLLDYLEKNDYKPFPHEKADGKNPKPHILCNSWPIFAILDCYPSKVEKLTPLCEWFLDIQNKDGSWNLIWDEKTKYPLFTSYALSVLLQFKICYENYCKETEIVTRVDKALKDGLAWLLANRAPLAKQEDLLLWPANSNVPDHKTISFSTSAISMHMFAKAGRYFNENKWIEMVEQTFLIICNNFKNENPDILTIGEMKINIWDQIHVNESSLNYYFSFFSPINLTTLLKLSESPKFNFSNNYMSFINFFVDWIIKNVVKDNGSYGVRGGRHLEEVKTWSTAQSVIVLSRILNTAYILLPQIISCEACSTDHKLSEMEKELNEQKISNKETIDFLKFIDKYLKEDNSFNPKTTKLIVNILFILLCFGMLYYLPDPIQKIWPEAEGKIWAFSQILLLVIAWFGFSNISKIHNKCESLLIKIYCCLQRDCSKISKLKELIDNYLAQHPKK